MSYRISTEGLGCLSIILVSLTVAVIVVGTIVVSLFFGIAWGMLALLVMLAVCGIYVYIAFRQVMKGKGEDDA